MRTQIFNILRTITLAVVLSFGLSYVYAWTAPTLPPPNGNVDAPINTGTTAQTKNGWLTAGRITSTGIVVATGDVISQNNNANSGVLSAVGLFGRNPSGTRPNQSGWQFYNMQNYNGREGLSLYEYYDANNDGIFCNDTGSCIDRLNITPGGNVGIGTTAPAKKLDVVGDIQASGDVCTTAGGGKCLSASGGFVITDVQTQGTACATLGAVAHDGSGSPLFCSYGSWRSATLSGFPGYSRFVYGPWSTTVPPGVSFATVSVYGPGGGGGTGDTGSGGRCVSSGGAGGAGGRAWVKIAVTSGQVLSGNNTSVPGAGAVSSGDWAVPGGAGTGSVTFPASSLVAYGGGGGYYSNGTPGSASGGNVVVGGGSSGGSDGGCRRGGDGTIGGVTIAYSIN